MQQNHVGTIKWRLFTLYYKSIYMNDNFFPTIFTIVGCAFIIVGMSFGMGSLKIIIPVVIRILVAVFAYQAKRHRLEPNDAKIAVSLAVMASLIIFVLVALGNCIGGCTKGSGDIRQQRIEMGLPPY